MTISAKVATILNERQLVVNVGSQKRVKVGDVVQVIDSVEINDPDTGENLGAVQQVRMSLRVEKVTTTFAIASTFELAADVLSAFFGTTKQATYLKIATSPQSVIAGLSVLVSPGDEVVIETPPKDPDPK